MPCPHVTGPSPSIPSFEMTSSEERVVVEAVEQDSPFEVSEEGNVPQDRTDTDRLGEFAIDDDLNSPSA